MPQPAELHGSDDIEGALGADYCLEVVDRA